MPEKGTCGADIVLPCVTQNIFAPGAFHDCAAFAPIEPWQRSKSGHSLVSNEGRLAREKIPQWPNERVYRIWYLRPAYQSSIVPYCAHNIGRHSRIVAVVALQSTRRSHDDGLWLSGIMDNLAAGHNPRSIHVNGVKFTRRS